MCDKKRHRKRAKYITLSLESKKGSSQTPMMRSISTVSVLLTMCARVTLVWSAYPFTFTDRECRDLFPERIGKDSLSVNEAHDLPFEIEPSETIHGVSLGGVQVTIKAVSKWRIKGLLMQARAVGKCEDPAQQRPLGHFEIPEYSALMASNCSGHKFETVTHKKYPLNETYVNVRWFPPEDIKDKIYFVATIVSGKDEFWTGIVSHEVRHHKDKEMATGDFHCPMRSIYNPSTSSKLGSAGSRHRSNHQLVIFLLVTSIIHVFWLIDRK
ncbi:putative defense protein Hdd11-like [Crassostrea virginica]